MHNALNVISSVESVYIPEDLLKVVFFSPFDVLSQNSDILVPIRPTLFVKEANRVKHLVRGLPLLATLS